MKKTQTKNDQFKTLFDINFVFNLRRYKVNKTAEILERDGLVPSKKNDAFKAILDNAQTDEDLRRHFLKI